MQKKLVLAVGILTFVVVAIQFIPVSTTNPPLRTEFNEPPQVADVLKQSCFNCHSHETLWPWYSRIAPISWLVASDVHEARSHVNFSLWENLTPQKKMQIRGECWDEVSGDDMPPFLYLLAHKEAVLSNDDKAVIKSWSTQPDHSESTLEKNEKEINEKHSHTSGESEEHSDEVGK